MSESRLRSARTASLDKLSRPGARWPVEDHCVCRSTGDAGSFSVSTPAGTGSPEKVELEPEVLGKADKLIADRVAQTERYGNLHHALAAGVVTRESVYGELGDLAAGRVAGREAAGEITVADLTGVGVQDAAIAQAVVEALGL